MTAGHYQVRFTETAEEDLMRLVDVLPNRAQDLNEWHRVEVSIRTLRQAVEKQLSVLPWSFRKAGQGSRTTRRELVLPAGAAGYVVLYEIESMRLVQVLAVRHHLEQDYH